MNWKNKREESLKIIKSIEAKERRDALAVWNFLSEKEKEEIKAFILGKWERLPKFIKRTITSKERYIGLEIKNYCLMRLKS